MAAKSNMKRIEKIGRALPEWERVDIEAWGGEPTFRVRNKNFIFSNQEATSISVKLPKIEAEAVVAGDDAVFPTGYGLGRHGWISVDVPLDVTEDRWVEIEEWIRTSYTLVAPKGLAKVVLEEDAAG